VQQNHQMAPTLVADVLKVNEAGQGAFTDAAS
jgi:hypothetical protein